MKPTRRAFLAGLSAMAIAPALAACGGDDGRRGRPAGRRRHAAPRRTPSR